MKFFQYVLIAVLGLFLLVRGIIPAMESVNTDFPNYYTSARLLVEGSDVNRFYDDNWFQDQIHRYGMNQLGKFAPFPPITALILTPLVFISPLNALRVWTVLNALFLLFAVALLARIAERSLRWSALLLLFSGHALANNFKFGQFYLLLTVLVMLGYRYWIEGKPTRGGLLLGVGAAIKYFPILYFVEFMLRREWRIVIAGVSAIVILTAISILILGPAVHEQFLNSILARHLEGNIQDPFSPTFQSWNSLFRRLFVYDRARNPNPAFESQLAYVICLLGIYCLVVTLVVVAFKKSRHANGVFSRDTEFGILGVAGLFLLPASATYHFLLLTLPVTLLLRGMKWSTPQKAVALLYGSIGFIPYRWFEHFESMGILTIFSYPRLMLMSGLFGASVAIAWMEPSTFNKQILQSLATAHDTTH